MHVKLSTVIIHKNHSTLMSNNIHMAIWRTIASQQAVPVPAHKAIEIFVTSTSSSSDLTTVCEGCLAVFHAAMQLPLGP
jgi:hypothetical protein